MAWSWTTASTFLVAGEPTDTDDNASRGSRGYNLAPTRWSRCGTSESGRSWRTLGRRGRARGHSGHEHQPDRVADLLLELGDRVGSFGERDMGADRRPRSRRPLEASAINWSTCWNELPKWPRIWLPRIVNATPSGDGERPRRQPDEHQHAAEAERLRRLLSHGGNAREVEGDVQAAAARRSADRLDGRWVHRIDREIGSERQRPLASAASASPRNMGSCMPRGQPPIGHP
jgi:hypothetical protein